MSEINSKKRISINVISSVLQVVFVGIIYLILYKYLLKTLGVEQLGVWSIILATTSIANLANFGITSGLVKFIADYNAKQKNDKISKLIFTSFISIVSFFAIIILLIYAFSTFFLGFVIDSKHIDLAIKILPYSLLCLFLNSVGGVFTSTLEGFQKNYLRNFIVLFSTLLLLISSYFLVPIYKLKGVAIAQVLQALLLLIASYILIVKEFKLKIFNQWNWDQAIFKELINFGFKFQIISVFQMLYEPITKGLISKFGGLGLLGYYEMASRLVTQLRALIVNANQVMVPVIAHTSNTDKEHLSELYNKTLSITYFVTTFLIAGILIFTPAISILWIGFLENNFIFSMKLLSISMFVNILVGPAYFSCIGEGKLNILLIAHVIIGVLNFFLGVFLGKIYNGNGVIIAWCFSLIVGSIYLIVRYQKTRKIKFKPFFSLYNILLFTISFIFVFLNLHYFNYLFHFFSLNIWIIIIVQMLVFVFLFLVFVFQNKQIIKMIKNTNDKIS